MKACENCKFWSAGDDYNPLVPGLAYCEKPKMYWECTEWVDHKRVLKTTGQKVFVQDGSDYMAYLITASDFFCNQHEDKP